MSLPAIVPLILSGGVGSRLWPLSRAHFPKQLLPLVGPRPMLAATALRTPQPRFAAPLVIAAAEHRFLVAEALRECGVASARIVLEPVARGTAPAVAAGALLALAVDPEAQVLVMPSDHVIADEAAFHAAIAVAARAAGQGRVVTFGITPTGPETGYGYIRLGAALEGVDGAFAVARFVEKPNAATAAGYLAEGGYAWNGGLLLASAAVLIEEIALHAPEVLAAARAAVEAAKTDLDFLRLDGSAFARSPNISIDHAVMERTARAAVVPAAMGWSDVGSWQSLWEATARDGEGNAVSGDALALDTRNSYVRSEKGPLVVTLGLDQAVVVATDDAVLVTTRARAEDMRLVTQALTASGRTHHLSSTTAYRPWGTITDLDGGARFTVRQIMVRPGGRLSLQYHHHRAEHWVVVEGTAMVTRGEETFLLSENESAFIRPGQKHRLENPGLVPLRLIEVQSGPYLGEDDVVRLEDAYGRVENG